RQPPRALLEEPPHPLGVLGRGAVLPAAGDLDQADAASLALGALAERRQRGTQLALRRAGDDIGEARERDRLGAGEEHALDDADQTLVRLGGDRFRQVVFWIVGGRAGAPR